MTSEHAKGSRDIRIVSATIEDAEIRRVSDLWRKKPTGVYFGDTDVLLLTLRTEEGKILKDAFYLRLKADGTFSTAAIAKRSRAKQLTFAKFLKQYALAEDPRRYNVALGVRRWKGKNVKVVMYDETGHIYLL